MFDHLTGQPVTGTRPARVEAARIAGKNLLPLAELSPESIDALLIPGGEGPLATLSDYAAKHELCQVDPAIVRLLRGMLQAHRPMGFIGSSALLAARVLGPVAGVRLTLGSKAIAGGQTRRHHGSRRAALDAGGCDRRSEGARPQHARASSVKAPGCRPWRARSTGWCAA